MMEGDLADDFGDLVHCVIGFTEHSSTDILMGLSFVKQFANLFDLDNKTITLQASSTSTTGTDITEGALANFYASVVGVLGVVAALSF